MKIKSGWRNTCGIAWGLNSTQRLFSMYKSNVCTNTNASTSTCYIFCRCIGKSAITRNWISCRAYSCSEPKPPGLLPGQKYYLCDQSGRREDQQRSDRRRSSESGIYPRLQRVRGGNDDPSG